MDDSGRMPNGCHGSFICLVVGQKNNSYNKTNDAYQVVDFENYRTRACMCYFGFCLLQHGVKGDRVI